MRTADHIPANYQVAPLGPIAPLNPANNIEPADDTLDSHDDHLEGFDLLQHLPNSPHHSALINSELSLRSGSMTWDTIALPHPSQTQLIYFQHQDPEQHPLHQ